MLFKYCAECGHKLDDIRLGDDDCKICPSCKRIYGRNPLPVVEVLVVNEQNEILLLKQNYISEDKWTVVSGYMVEGEVFNIKITFPYDMKVANTLLKGKEKDA